MKHQGLKRMKERTALWAAYRRTTYVVHTSHGDIPIRPGRRSLALDGLLNERRARDWAFVTAYNPASKPLAHEENARRHQELADTVRDRGLAFLDGEGVGEDERWPAEPSILILGIEPDDARALGRQFGQLAIVVGRTGQPARLVACAEGTTTEDMEDTGDPEDHPERNQS
jgi:hypothetical protein